MLWGMMRGESTRVLTCCDFFITYYPGIGPLPAAAWDYEKIHGSKALPDNTSTGMRGKLEPRKSPPLGWGLRLKRFVPLFCRPVGIVPAWAIRARETIRRREGQARCWA